MALLLAEAKKLSNNQLELGVVEEIIDKEDLFAVLPFMAINGKAYVYNRENTLSEGDFLDPSGTVLEGAATFTEVTTTLRILIGDVDVDKFMQGTLSDTNNQKAIQIASKAKGLTRKFRRTLMIGDSSVTSQEFDGLDKIARTITTDDSTRTIFADGSGAAGAALNFSMLDKLLDAVPNGADVLFMPESVIRAFRSLLRVTGGGTSAAEIMLPAFGRPMLTHNGIPILTNNFIPVNETQGTSTGITTSVYAARLNESDGLHGIYGGGTAGLVVEDIGTVQNKDSSRTRIKWYVGLVLKSTKSLARLKGLTNIV
jgi:hypothetical protein